jgi:hypothetical protein
MFRRNKNNQSKKSRPIIRYNRKNVRGPAPIVQQQPVFYPVYTPPAPIHNYHLQPNYLQTLAEVESGHLTTYIRPNYSNNADFNKLAMSNKYTNLNPNYGTIDSEIESISSMNITR